MEWLTKLVTITNADEDVRRRGRLIAILTLAMSGLAILFVPMVLLQPNAGSGLTAIGACLALYAGLLWLTHHGRITLAGYLLAGSVTVAALATMPFQNSVSTAPFYLVLAVLLAGVVLPARQIWLFMAFNLIALAVAIAFLPYNLIANGAGLQVVIGSALMVLIGAFIGFLGANGTEQALAAARDHARNASAAQAEAEQQARTLATQTDALAAAEQRLRELVATLETPAVMLADGVLLAPLVGALDSRRAQDITAHLLHAVAEQCVRLLVLDVTGVAVIDTAVAQALLQTIHAVRLLGCEVAMTGISATVATTITHLGIQLDGVQIARSPQDILSSLTFAGNGHMPANAQAR